MKVDLVAQFGTNIFTVKDLNRLYEFISAHLSYCDYVQLDVRGIQLSSALIQKLFTKLHDSFHAEDLENRFRVICLNTDREEIKRFLYEPGVESDVN